MNTGHGFPARASADRIVIIGAGIAGLATAVRLSAWGANVTVFESADRVGGKIAEIAIGGQAIDCGPTVVTMRWVFDELFAAAGTDTARHLTLKPAEVLARHAWNGSERLDLFADVERTARAIDGFAGPDEANRYRGFCERSAKVYQTLEQPFIRSARPSPIGLATSRGLGGLRDLAAIEPFSTLWGSLSAQFRDPRLRQLFARYATYCGSSPFQSPATLMLVAHVEQRGVWTIEGGMHALPKALEAVARSHGADLRLATPVDSVTVHAGAVSGVRLASGETVAADAVVFTGDVSALGTGLLGSAVRHAAPPTPPRRRSLSALTLSMVASADGFPLVRHNVFFGNDYRSEFDDVFRRGSLPKSPTVYVCAQDRGTAPLQSWAAREERLFAIVNAPAIGDRRDFEDRETEECLENALALLERCGLCLQPGAGRTVTTTPADFARRYPATGGALYGPASHGWRASFQRSGATTRIPRLYLAGGSVHPGPGIPMAALSGRQAAERVMQDLTSRNRFRRAATPGGTSTR